MKPKRKRAYHRALKRGETWALRESGMRGILNKLISELYYPPYQSFVITGLSQALAEEE